MDLQTIDSSYERLNTQAGQTQTALTTLAQKLQTAAAAGNTDAREWGLDLREIALAMQAEQQQVALLLQSLHDFMVAHADQPLTTAQPVVAAPAVAAQPPAGGLLSRFMGGGFGQAMAQGAGMGVGFGVGESIINDIFN